MNIKKVLSVIVGASMLLSTLVTAAPAQQAEFEYETVQTEKVTAASGTCGENLTWTLDDAGTLTISGTGDMANYSWSNVPWHSNSSSIKTVTIGDGITCIGENAFFGCSDLTSITIPDSVTSIGNYAFENCSNLTSVTIPDSVTSIGDDAFSKCYSLTSVTIPDSVTSIGGRAFYNCSSLTSVTIGDGVTNIGEWAFGYCSSLVSITIPDSVTSIGYGVFSDCSSLTSITIPDSVTSIGDKAFCRCSTSITVDENNEYYSSDEYGVLFNKDKTVLIQYPMGNERTSYVIPNSVTSIGDYAFYDCLSLTSVIIPDSVTSIGRYAFSRCSSLTSITIPDSVTSIGAGAFYKCSSLTSITIGDSVTSIGGSAFYLCSKLTSVTIPDSVTSIGGSAFENCSSLTSVVIPDSVTSIGDYAFFKCSKLTSITIPDSVTSIGDKAFSECSSIETVFYNGTAEEWGNVTVGSGNDYLLEADIIYLGDIKAPELTNASIELYSALTLNFKADASQFEGSDFVNPYVVVTLNGVETVIRDYTVDDGKYVFKFENISANMINDTVTAVLYSTIGEKVFESEPIEYSIATYCYNTLETYSDNEELRTLLVDLLNYGASSQIYSGYKTNALANAKLTDEQKSWASTTTGELTSVQNTKYETISAPKATWKSAGLNLMDKVEFRIKFISETSDALSVKIKSESGREWTVDAENITDISDELANGYMFYFDGADATMMSETLYFTVYSGDEAISDTFSYSIESYISKKINTEDTAFASLLECIIKYGNAAENYVNQ